MLKIYTVDNSKEWDQIVYSFKDYDIYYMSGYVKGFRIHGDGEPLLFYYEDKDIRGINVVMKRDISLDLHFNNKINENKYFDFATPYGYGGWIIEGEGNAQKLFDEYEKWCKKNNIISEFVRFHPVIENHIFSKDFYEVIALGNTVTMDLSSPEIIWSNITSKNRNVIRKAQKNNIKIYASRNPEIFKIFHSIYNETMDKDNADNYYYFNEEFYESILEDIPYNSLIFYAQMEDGTIIATAIILMVNGKVSYHLSGSLREFQQFAPSNLLLYEVAMWGNQNGYKTFHLGGGVGSGEDNLLKFKKAFYRKELCRYHIGKKIYLKEEYQRLIAMRDDIEKDNFFPRYRG